MKKLLAITCLEIFMLSCSIIHKYNPNDNSMNNGGQRYDLQVHNWGEIPKELLGNLDKMGVDASSVLNEYEGEYLNFIFEIDPKNFDLIGKRVGFLGSKIDYFKNTRSPDRNSTTVGGSSLYIFDTAQKRESGGYDAAIVYWSKFVIPIEKVVKRLKEQD